MPNYVRDITTNNKIKFLESVSAFDVPLPGLCPPGEFISTGEQCLNFSHGLTRKVFSELSVSPPAIKRKVHKTFRLRRSAPPIMALYQIPPPLFPRVLRNIPLGRSAPGLSAGRCPRPRPQLSPFSEIFPLFPHKILSQRPPYITF